MVDIDVKIIPALVHMGKDQDVSVREMDLNPASDPENRALFAFYDATKNETFTKIIGIFAAKETLKNAANDPPTPEECAAHVNGKLEGVLPNYKAGPALVMARVIQDGRWVPPQNPPPPNAAPTFPFAFLLRDKNNDQDFKIDLPLRKNTYLTTRVLIVVQKA